MPIVSVQETIHHLISFIVPSVYHTNTGVGDFFNLIQNQNSPTPSTPRSPSPKILLPSVTTEISKSSGRESNISAILPFSLYDKKRAFETYENR